MAYRAARQRQAGASQVATARNQNTGFSPEEDIRIVLIGKTGNGKSESGNTILNRRAFKSALSPSSVTSECEKARGVVNGCRVAVIDTPGIYDTKYKEAEVIRKLKECVSLSAPGPHVFLIVVKLDRFTEEEQKTVELLRLVFGAKAADYFLVLFTHGDRLRRTTVEEYFSKCGKLSHLIAQCNWRYHVFNNTVTDNHQEAERAIQDEAKKIMEENAEKKRRQEEELRKQLQGEELQERLQWLNDDYIRQSREKAEKKNKFLETSMVTPSVEAGIAIGIGAAAAGGPLCIAVGAVVGGAVGAVVGLLTPAAVKALKRKCTVQ